jgi:hypothetical protein
MLQIEKVKRILDKLDESLKNLDLTSPATADLANVIPLPGITYVCTAASL